MSDSVTLVRGERRTNRTDDDTTTEVKDRELCSSLSEGLECNRLPHIISVGRLMLLSLLKFSPLPLPLPLHATALPQRADCSRLQAVGEYCQNSGPSTSAILCWLGLVGVLRVVGRLFEWPAGLLPR